MNGNVIRTITIRGTSEGLDKLQSDLAKLAAGHKGVTIAQEEMSKSSLSLEQAWKRQTLALDENARAQDKIARATKIAQQYEREGRIDKEQLAQRIELINRSYNLASQSTQKFAQQTGLARHELVNLSRQAADVGVSLVSGQSPFMVLAQQGSQIADVFISSGKSVGSFFGQAIGWAGRFIGSVAGITSAVAGTTAAVGYMVSSFAQAQKEIDKVLSGTGAASGTTRGGINRIAEGAAGGGLSIAGAREAALAFASTGKIYEQNINTATNLTREFARAMGIDTADAAKQLAAALVDPSKGALDLNKQLGFLDATTLNYIRTLQSQGKLQEAQNVLMVAAGPAIGKQADQVSVLTRAWDFATKALSNFDEANAKAIARSLERMTGADLGGFDLQEQLTRARARQSELQTSRTPGLSAPQLKLVTAEVERLEQKLVDLIKATDDQRFNQLALAADAFTRALLPSIEQVERLTLAISTLERAKAETAARGGAADPNQAAALQVAQMQLSLAREGVQVEQRKAEIFAQNAAAYSNVSASTAQILAQMQTQLGVAQAITGAAQIEAQHRATIAQWLAQGKTLVDATAIADAKRALTVAQVNAGLDQQLRSLQEQAQVLRGVSEMDQARIRAAQEYQKAIDAGGDAAKAGAIAAQTIANARIAEDAKDTSVSWSVANEEAGKLSRNANAVAAATSAAANEAARLQANYNKAVVALKFLPMHTLDALAASSGTDIYAGLFKGSQGYQQYDPNQLYAQADTWTQVAVQLKALYGEGGYKAEVVPYGGGEYVTPTAQGYVNLLNKRGNLSDPMAAITDLLGKAGGDPNIIPLISRLGGLVPEAERSGVIQKQIDLLKGQPQSLESMELIKQLTDSLKQLTEATDQNTSATSAMTDVLSPFYSSDPRRTHLGFRAFAGGGIMTPYGELPLRSYQGGGMATSPQVAVFGEGSMPEAFVPAPAGRIPVEVRMPANSNRQRPVNVTINVMGNADSSTVAALKQTSFQRAQELRRITG